MNSKSRIYLYDSTLRDGAQTSTIDFSSQDKREIAMMIDSLGIDYIEGGWPGANHTDDSFFNNLPKLKKSKFSCFGMTRKPNNSVHDDFSLNSLINSDASSICIVGKAWDFHLTNALNISEDENIKMISESISYIKSKNKEAIFDAEHFFDGYKDNPEFSLKCIKAAYDSGARWVVLCDTNGGTLPTEIYDIIQEVTKYVPGENLGIHCHNDTGNAVANSLIAVKAGVRQIQGTINGLGERCGNANLISLIPTLMLKMDYDIGISPVKLKELVKVSSFLNNLIGRESYPFAPYVGKFAFAHKGGLHVSAITKNPKSYEHVEPESIGNSRVILVSDQAGRSNIIARLKEIGLEDSVDKIKYSKISELVNKIKELESKGYAYDNADASFEILAKRELSVVPEFFKLVDFTVIDKKTPNNNGDIVTSSEAKIIIKIDDKEISESAKGNGPVNALDKALRLALSKKYTSINKVKLTDYKVRILTPSDATEAITRVKIESQDNKGNKWSTIGVSPNIVDASYKALRDSIIFQLMKKEKF